MFGTFPSGVTALAAQLDGDPVGIAASSFTSVSLDPPLASVCVAASSTTWPILSRAPYLGVSVLGEAHEDACRQLAAKDGDRFAGLAWRVTGEGAILLEDASAWFVCRIEQCLVAGDHQIVVLGIHDYAGDPSIPPLVFHRGAFRRLR
ncbi:flavin reductase family protein [Dactylosporangium fulvum]|uniref:Flavin reductase family protein n=1 Tax=Dactylosporangium fulvum TaxID=53359 RepID=A0ABY5VRW2_9ACTN|nr:flavin reductase family protein [Dactylosporangium fulvum]UWP80025.1 flavin reductase family protein [Dactylosporangium fulvum]